MTPLESLLRSFVDAHPDDAARAFETLDADEATKLLGRLPISVASHLLERLSRDAAGRLLVAVKPQRAADLLAALPPRTSSSLLHHFDESQREAVFADLPEETAASLRNLLSYPDTTAGGMMEPNVVALAIDLTAQQAITKIRKAPREALHYLYVTSRDGRLAGVLNMRDLLLASPRDPIEPLTRRELMTVPATMEREEVVNLMRERRFLALPVVDDDGRLVGVVKHDEALLAGQQEAFEDLQKTVGAGAEERALSPIGTVVRCRLPWLYVNLVTAFMAAAVVGVFEETIAAVAALAVLMPVVAGQGGNTGSQSLAIVMRGLALREIMPGVRKRVIVKEFLAGLINGVCVAIVTGLVVFVWQWWAGGWVVSTKSVGLAVVICLAMIINMAAAAFSGAVIPLILKSLGRDPAQSSAIFLTTVTDIVGFASFLGFAVIFFPMLT